ncbi:ribosomal protein S5 domain 2-like protein [Guyanagaster necrorhizus]|uniref:Ribosomal protein S5 domain 2-like protein n=1 Tax=Guyanagaster necrorhizus TaxID=856835 RepID=A0A9P7VY84_9AGAR|nr:ribosomal protein S5 domain 2-like protein [Guyanagaster necrorhizus MCA 3950]KAG7449761.1 ribosomal protein S5 domain 2-like protein [Guyanagaster necrorhizus MCA 3950]
MLPNQARFSSGDNGDTSRWPRPIYASERITIHKSTFLAHATEIRDGDMVPEFIDHLTSLPQLKRATHCMYAYRVSSESTKLSLGQQDGGESGAGDHLARLLELSRCENVVVVVSRWYGGVQLGSERWRRISEVAKDALNKGGFMRKREENTIQSGTSKKGRKPKKKK